MPSQYCTFFGGCRSLSLIERLHLAVNSWLSLDCNAWALLLALVGAGFSIARLVGVLLALGKRRHEEVRPGPSLAPYLAARAPTPPRGPFRLLTLHGGGDMGRAASPSPLRDGRVDDDDRDLRVRRLRRGGGAVA